MKKTFIKYNSTLINLLTIGAIAIDKYEPNVINLKEAGGYKIYRLTFLTKEDCNKFFDYLSDMISCEEIEGYTNEKY